MLENAILRTVVYANIFSYPLTLDELHTYLICDERVSCQELEQALYHSPRLQDMLVLRDGYIALIENNQTISLRQTRERIATQLLPKAHRYGKWLSQIPFVRMVALTGALAMSNPSSEADDVDYLLVVERGRVWMARAFAVMMVRLVRLLGTELCPNYVLSSDNLPQKRQDLYIAHEVAQMIPLYGQDLYQEMLACNTWAQTFLPNASGHTLKDSSHGSHVKNTLEYLLSGRVGQWLESWEYHRKSQKFLPQTQHAATGAHIDADTVKGHFNDHGQRVLEAYQERLRALNLA